MGQFVVVAGQQQPWPQLPRTGAQTRQLQLPLPPSLHTQTPSHIQTPRFASFEFYPRDTTTTTTSIKQLRINTPRLRNNGRETEGEPERGVWYVAVVVIVVLMLVFLIAELPACPSARVQCVESANCNLLNKI